MSEKWSGESAENKLQMSPEEIDQLRFPPDLLENVLTLQAANQSVDGASLIAGAVRIIEEYLAKAVAEQEAPLHTFTQQMLDARENLEHSTELLFSFLHKAGYLQEAVQSWVDWNVDHGTFENKFAEKRYRDTLERTLHKVYG